MSTKHNIYGSLFVSNNITGDTLTLSTINQDDTLTKVLVWSDSSNRIVYRNLSTITGDTNVDTNTFVSGGTYNGITNNIDFNGNSTGTTFSVDLTSLVNSVSGDTYIVSGNANAATSELTFNYNTGGTIVVTNSAALFSDNDINVTGGTYNPSNGCVTFNTNSGTTFDVCGFVTGLTDSYTTTSYLSGSEIRFDNNIQGVNYYNVDLDPLLSGFTTGNTLEETLLLGNVSNGNDIVMSEGDDIVFKYAGFNNNINTNPLTSNRTILFQDKDGVVALLSDTTGHTENFYVTGFTYDNANTFTISRNDGVDLNSSFNTVTGLTVNGDLDVTGDTTLGPLTATSVTSNSAINVFNEHINIRDNSYFLQGRTVADVNVSLIGVDNQDRVFVGNAGYDTYIDSDTIVDGVLSAQTTFLTTTPTLNNLATDVLVRNSSTGEVEYRPVSGITPDTNTFVISGTYVDSTDTLALLRNDGNFVNITGITDTFVTGTTFGSNQATLSRNDAIDVLKITGDTNVVLSNPSTNQVKIGLDLGIKSGTVRGTDFTGSPLTIKVTFTTPYPDTDYSVNVTGSINRNFTFESKTAASFIISSNSSTSFSDDVDWFTIKYGEQ
jgi:hypothetical protein